MPFGYVFRPVLGSACFGGRHTHPALDGAGGADRVRSASTGPSVSVSFPLGQGSVSFLFLIPVFSDSSLTRFTTCLFRKLVQLDNVSEGNRCLSIHRPVLVRVTVFYSDVSQVMSRRLSGPWSAFTSGVTTPCRWSACKMCAGPAIKATQTEEPSRCISSIIRCTRRHRWSRGACVPDP